MTAIKRSQPSPRCTRCRRRYDEARGDGYCGLCPGCTDATEPHDAECGILAIDWRRRRFSVRGAGGHANDVMRPAEVLRALSKQSRRGVERIPFIVWKGNADGYAQLCLHTVAGFKKEFTPEELEE